MRHRQQAVNSPRTQVSCIEQMETLLSLIADFKQFINTPDKMSKSDFNQEYRLFKQHVEWVSEDLVTQSKPLYLLDISKKTG